MTYNYNSTDPVKITLAELDDRKRFLLDKSQRFCMLPWIHLHAAPNGDTYPCCHSMNIDPVGSARTHTLAEIWNSPAQRQIRTNMLTEQPSAACRRCYEQEASGFFSGRRSANKHFGHYIDRIDSTDAAGTQPEFSMTYWDIRFSNLCNLSCRSCGHVFSSNWYQDQARLAGPEWKLANSVLTLAGRSESDMWDQLQPHLDSVEQIYFAGGEPLLMAEHYHILEELLARGRTDVRLIYNTNFTHTDLKGRSVFEYWNEFDSVAVGASLDGSHARGEYIRKGTDWSVVEQNRRAMLAVCPDVDFYISATLSIFNVQHLPDFHRSWVDQGLIRPQDFNVNILQDPRCYRIDIATPELKQQILAQYQQHCAWLHSEDHLRRASTGYASAMQFMMAQDNSGLIPEFWRRTHELDAIRKENILDAIPELAALL